MAQAWHSVSVIPQQPQSCRGLFRHGSQEIKFTTRVNCISIVRTSSSSTALTVNANLDDDIKRSPNPQGNEGIGHIDTSLTFSSSEENLHKSVDIQDGGLPSQASPQSAPGGESDVPKPVISRQKTFKRQDSFNDRIYTDGDYHLQ